MTSERAYFLKTQRLGLSRWTESDTDLAEKLWGDPLVTEYICASGVFSHDDVLNRLKQEIERDREHGVQYWPVFQPDTDEFVGCCGLRPHGEGEYELGFHLRPEFWARGYATEIAGAVIGYAFNELHAVRLVAGHNPRNLRSRRVIEKLGFNYTGDEYYEPTGLYHPSYEMYPPVSTQEPRKGLE